MFKRLLNWFRKSPEPHPPSPVDPLRRTGSHALPRRQPDFAEPDPDATDNADTDSDTHKRSHYVREDTGTHETLKIIDDSLDEANDEDGIDPYNSGRFDRSRNWDKRSR